MNLKKAIALICAGFTLCSGSAFAATAEFTIDSDKFYISDSGITQNTLDASPYIENSRTMVPARAVSESFGADVSWDEASQKVSVKYGENLIELTINSDTALVNGEAVSLDSPALIRNNRTMIPLRFVSEALGKYVEYVGSTKQILISDEEPVFVINGTPVTTEDYRSWLWYSGYEYAEENISQALIQATANFMEMYAFSAETKKMNLVSVPYDSDTEIQYIMENKDEIYNNNVLVAPIVKIREAILNMAMYFEMGDFNTSVEEIKEYYNENYVRAKHILIMSGEDGKTAKKEAEKVLALAKKGEDFDKLIKEYGEDPGTEAYPDGYTFTYNEMVPEFEKAAFELEVGKISDLVETTYGYHIIKKEPLLELGESDIAVIGENLFKAKYQQKSTELVDSAEIQVNPGMELLEEKMKPIQQNTNK